MRAQWAMVLVGVAVLCGWGGQASANTPSPGGNGTRSLAAAPAARAVKPLQAPLPATAGAPPSAASLGGIACAAPQDCVAVGDAVFEGSDENGGLAMVDTET